MKIIIPIGLLIILAIACNQSKREKFDQTTATPTKETNLTQAKKAIDVPNLVGKSQNEVKKLLGEPVAIDKLNTTDATGEISFDYKLEQGSGFINFKEGIFNYLHFTSKQDFPTFLPLGDLVGLDLRDAVPSTSNSFNVIYTNTDINGIKFKEVRVSSDGRYSIITVRVK